MKNANPITAAEVAIWFSQSIKNGRKPVVTDCALLASYLEDARQSALCSGWNEPEQRRKSHRLTVAFDELIQAMKEEAAEQKKFEDGAYAIGSRPSVTYSDTLYQMLENLYLKRTLIIVPANYLAWPSELHALTFRVAVHLLVTWNKVRNTQTASIGRDTPLQAILALAMNRITQHEHNIDALRSSLARADQKLLRQIINMAREDFPKIPG